MSDKRTFVLAHAEARQRAVRCVTEAPEGYAVVVQEPTRTLEQNALLWVLLEAFSEQLQWPVNGVMCRLSPEDWKSLFTASYRNETQRIALGLNGGMVMLGGSTSRMGKREFAGFLDFIGAEAAQRGVVLDEETD